MNFFLPTKQKAYKNCSLLLHEKYIFIIAASTEAVATDYVPSYLLNISRSSVLTTETNSMFYPFLPL